MWLILRTIEVAAEGRIVKLGNKSRLASVGEDHAGCLSVIDPEVTSQIFRLGEIGARDSVASDIAIQTIGSLLKTATGFEYRLEKRLGCGGQSNVFLATRVSDQELVAFKIATRGGQSLENMLIERESRNLARLDHPHIVRVLECGHTDKGESYAALEVVVGHTLEEILRIKRRLSKASALAICLQIADAMEHAHERGVIHGDLKPGNIMISELDGSEHVYVVDFGISSTVEEPRPRASEFTYGSLWYMSPEQLFDDELTERSDIYQLGLILYECIFGNLPYSQDRASAIAFRRTPIDDWHDGAADLAQLSSEWQDLFKKMLATESDKRFATMHHVVREFRKLAAAFMPASAFCGVA